MSPETPETQDSRLVRSVTFWRPDEPPSDATSTGEEDAPGIVWFDLVSGAEATHELLDQLEPSCPGLDGEMLGDLLTPDEEPEGSTYADGSIRLASTFSAEAPRPGGKVERGSARRAGVLIFRPVELLAGDGWLLTCAHPSRTFAGAEKVREGAPIELEEIERSITRAWVRGPYSTSGDLGTHVMHELAMGYRAAGWALAAWHEDWELSLYVEDEIDNPGELPSLWGAMAVLRDWLNPLNRPGLRTDPSKAWLPATDHDLVVAVDDQVDQTLDQLSNLANVMRSSFNVLHVQLAETERSRKERTRHRVELLAAIFLVPTLVVGFYGANTWVPGENRHWGFWVMLAVLVIFSGVALAVVRHWRRDEENEALRIEAQRSRDRELLLRDLS